MLITRDFVFLHLPKTGGTFAKNALQILYAPKAFGRGQLAQLSIFGTEQVKTAFGIQPHFLEISKHGYRRDLPAKFSHLPIAGCMRNPFDWYVSNFKYQFWRTHPKFYPGVQAHAKWPNLGFEDYMQLSMSEWLPLRNPEITVNKSLGRLTTLFINWYCQKPNKLLLLDTSDDEIIEALKHEVDQIHFLDTKNLNRDLYDYLLSLGYSAEKLKAILDQAPISPRGLRLAEEKWPAFYNDELFSLVLEQDRILFQLFPQYLPAA